MRTITAAVTQMACSLSREENISKAESLVQNAAERGANIILLQELFSDIYFCQEYKYDYFRLAETFPDNDLLRRMRMLAKKCGVVLPISFFEKCGNVYYNTAAMIDADGEVLGVYRKSHIPDDPGYYEKFYFTPGNTGFCVWDTKFARIGVGICWDQWFPEAARCMALMGAELLLYPAAIGGEAVRKELLSSQKAEYRKWQNAMIGHSIANMIPVAASNRVGIEEAGDTAIRFFGSSFITNSIGEITAEAGQSEEGAFLATIDLDEIQKTRYLRFRDRRTDLYSGILQQDGTAIRS